MRTVLSIAIALLAVCLMTGTAKAVTVTVNLTQPNSWNMGDSLGKVSDPTTPFYDTGFLDTGFANGFESIIKFNINNSQIPSYAVINSAMLYLNCQQKSESEYANVSIFGSDNISWVEDTASLWAINFKIATVANNYTLVTSNQSVLGCAGTTDDWIALNVTSWVSRAKGMGKDNVTFIINDTNITRIGYYAFASKETPSANYKYLPTLNVTYSTPDITEQWESNILETKYTYSNISIYTTGTAPTNVSLFLNGSYYPFTTLVSGGFYYNYTFRVLPNLVQGNINLTNVTHWYNISFGTFSNTSTGNQTNQTLNRLRIDSCAEPITNRTVQFSIYDEDTTTTKVVSNFNSAFQAWVDGGYRNYSFTNTSYADYSFCIFPGWLSSFNANISATYNNASYSTRNYFAQSKPLTNTTTQIDLYSLSTTNSTNIFFTVYDQNKIPQPNVVLKALRYYPATGTFVEVALGKTGYDGMVMIPLELYQYYQYIMLVNGFTVASTSSSQLSSITQNLYISPSNYVILFDYINLVNGGCTVNNATKVVSCTINDQSGKLSYSYLTVKQMKAANYSVQVCSVNSSASTAILSCNLSYWNTSNLYYTFTGVFNGVPQTTYTFSSGFISWAGPLMQTGLMGVFLSMILVITLFFAGMTNSPSSGIALGCVGLLVSSLSGLINIGWANLFPMILVAVIIVYKLED